MAKEIKDMPEEFYSLVPKRQEFIRQWFVDRNGTQSAIRAGYSSKGASVTASDLLANPKIRSIIDQIEAQADEAVNKLLEVTKEKTLRRLMQGQEFDVRRLYHLEDYFRPDGEMVPAGTLKLPPELDDDTAKAVVGVKYDKDTGVLVEYKVIDVKGCAELVGKHLRLWNEVGSPTNPLTVSPIHDLSREELLQIAAGNTPK